MTGADIDLDVRVGRADFTLDVALSLPGAGVTGIHGPSGSGKTTLLRTVAGLEPTARGRVTVGGRAWQDDAGRLPPERREVGYVFQEPRLFRHLDVRGNLEYAAKRRSGGDGPDQRQALDLLGLEGLLNRPIAGLSGGEAQRVAIARALFRSPRLLLMDEPLAGLDTARRDDLMPYLDRLHNELSLPILYVSHEMDEIARLADHLLLLDAGRVRASGPLQAVLTDPAAGLAGGRDAAAVVDATIESFDATDTLTELTFSGGRLFVTGRHGAAGQRLRVRIRATDVSISLERPVSSSILNVVPATVDAIDALDAGSVGTATLRLRAGDDWLLARITLRSLRELKLDAGMPVYAQLKTSSIRNLPLAGHLG